MDHDTYIRQASALDKRIRQHPDPEIRRELSAEREDLRQTRERSRARERNS